MASVFPFPLPVARRFRLRASTRRFSLGPFRYPVVPSGSSPASVSLSRRQRPSFPLTPESTSTVRAVRSVGAGLTTRSSEQRLAVGFFLQSTSCAASLCR